MPIISHIYMDDLFFPFIYENDELEPEPEQIRLYIEYLPFPIEKDEKIEEERVIIIDIL